MKYLFFLFFILSSCISKNYNDLKFVERIINENLDSAYTILNSLDKSQLNHRRDKAKFALLYTQAAYKLGENFENDSLISIAREYYSSKGNLIDYADALMYNGAVLFECYDYKGAIEYYKEADEIYSKFNDDERLGLINTRLGEVYQHLFEFDSLAIDYLKNALFYFRRLNDSCRIINTMSFIGSSYIFTKNNDSSLFYLCESLKMAKRINNLPLIKNNIYFLMVYYNKNRKYDESIRLANEAIESGIYNINIYNQLCDSYILKGDTNLAIEVFNKVKDYNQDIKNLNFEYKLFEHNGQYKDALTTYKQIVMLADSLSRNNHKRDIMVIDKKYDYQKILTQREKERYNSVVIFMILVFISLMLALCLLFYINQSRRREKMILQKMSYIEQLKVDYNRNITLNDKITKKEMENEQYAKAISRRLTTLNKLIDISYRYSNNNAAFVKEYKQVMDIELTRDDIIDDVYHITNKRYENILVKLEKKYPSLSNTDIKFISLKIAGFSNTSLTLLYNYSDIQVVYGRSNRISKKMNINIPLDKFLKDLFQYSMIK